MPTESLSTRHSSSRQRRRHLPFNQRQVEHRLVRKQHGQGAHRTAKISRLGVHVPELRQLVLHERVRGNDDV